MNMVKIKRITDDDSGIFIGHWWFEIDIFGHGVVGIGKRLDKAAIDCFCVAVRLFLQKIKL